MIRKSIVWFLAGIWALLAGLAPAGASSVKKSQGSISTGLSTNSTRGQGLLQLIDSDPGRDVEYGYQVVPNREGTGYCYQLYRTEDGPENFKPFGAPVCSGGTPWTSEEAEREAQEYLTNVSA